MIYNLLLIALTTNSKRIKMTYVPTKEIKIKERQDKFLKAQLEKEREQALLEEIEKTEKERVKKKGTVQQIKIDMPVLLVPTFRLTNPFVVFDDL